MNTDKAVEGITSNFYIISRYVIAGVIPIITIWFVDRSILKPGTAEIEVSKNILATLGIVGVIGCLLYAVHRAFVFAIFHNMLLAWVYSSDWARIQLVLVPTLEFQHSYRLWRRTSQPIPPAGTSDDSASSVRSKRWTSMQAKLTEWATQVHLLYCASLGVIVGGFLALNLGNCEYLLERASFAIFVGIVGIFASLISHLRYLIFERLLQDFEQRTKIAPDPFPKRD